jgi:SAM-dependent methyltransferase
LRPELGISTDYAAMVQYRVALAKQYMKGFWLDLGCGNGGYDSELLLAGVDRIVGVDVEPERVAFARGRGLNRADYFVLRDETLPFDADCFDGVWMNEVLEHVCDERLVLSEVHRVLRPGGVLVLMSPNRWFPFEGHGMRIGARTVDGVIPLLPWLPRALVGSVFRARNYWPRDVVSLVKSSGLHVSDLGFAWPVFEVNAWLPERWINWYRKRITNFDHLPGIRRFGISIVVVAEKHAHGANQERTC